jgi:hypothetical protein
MATGGLYGSSPTGAVVAAPGSESAGLYGNGTTFGGSYFEWFIFIQSATQPATPTGGSWSFSTNSGTPPTGWSSTPPSAPTLPVWVSIALVNSKNTTALVWSAPGLFSYSSGLPILSGTAEPTSGTGLTDQLYIQTDTTPETIWFKQAGTWTRLTGSSLYVDLTTSQTIAGTKTFSSQIQGSVSGTSSNVTGIVGITNGGTGSSTSSGARTALGAAASGANSDITSLTGLTTALSIAQGGTGQTTANTAFNALAPSQTGNSGKYLTTDGSNTSWATNPLGTVTSINVSGGTTGLTTSGGPVTTSGTITLAGTLAVANGGTGVTTSTGSGNNVLSTSPTLTTPTQATYENWTGISAPTYAEGRTWYDSGAHALAYYNDSSNAVVHIGQDLQIKVINNTGSTIANGSPVYITGTSSGQPYPNIALAKADVAATSSVIGLTNGSIANGAIGYVTSQGGIDNVNTGTFTVGQVLYLSPYSAGQLMNTIPPTGITVQVGVVSYVDASAGKIYVKQTTPLNVPASIISGTVAIANGGTGQTTANAAFNALAPSQTGNSGKYLTTDGTNTSWATNPLGTVTSVGGTGTVSGISLSGTVTTSGNLTLGGALDLSAYNGAGAFTTLSASSTVSGTGFSTYLASPPAIGGTSPNTGNFTTLTNSGGVRFNTSGTEYARLQLSGTSLQMMAGSASVAGITIDSSNVATFTNNPVLSAGSANGVTYLNGSKVLTSGSALTFNGTNLFTTGNIYGGTGNANANILAYSNVANGGAGFSQFLFANTSTETRGFLSYSHAAEAILFGTSNVEQMRLTSTGLGIGTSSPAAKLHSSKADGGYVFAVSGTTKGMRVSTDANQTLLQGVDNTLTASYQPLALGGSVLLFQSNGTTEAMRIDASQNVGIGTSSPSEKLSVSGNITNTGTATFGTSGSNTYVSLNNNGYLRCDVANWFTLQAGTSGYQWRNSANSATAQMTLDSSGNLGLGVTPSASWTGGGVLQQTIGAIYGNNSLGAYDVAYNSIRTASNSYVYASTGLQATRFQQRDGAFNFFTAPSGTAGNAISFTQAMTLDASGNLGIGTTSPSTKLQVNDTITIGVADKAVQWLNSGTALADIRADSSSNLIFRNTSSYTERARIDSSGNLLLGTTSTTYGTISGKFISSSATSLSAGLFYTNFSGDVSTSALNVGKYDNNTTTSQIFMKFGINNANNGSGQINANGAGSAAFGSFSDRRLKENIVDLPSQLSKIMALRPVEFDYIESEGGGHQTGFIAQEMQEIYPDSVGEREDGMLTISGWSKTEARLVKAIQELKAEFDAYKARNP